MEKNEVTRETLASTFPTNSKSQKAKSDTEKLPEDKKIEKVVTGKVKKQKRGFGKKLAETFLEDNTKSVGDYVFHDVLIPAAKSMVCDIVGWGGFAEMLLFGSVRGGSARTTRQGGKSYTSYGSYFSSSIRDRDSGKDKDRGRDISRAGRARHDFDEIILETRGESEEVLSHLVDLTIDYGQATVADLYDLVGITSEFTDNKYGWTDLRNASVSRVRGGYLINLPRAVPID
jgi:hypothetical protein